MEKPYLGMLGYTAEGRPFLLERGVDVKDAKEQAGKNNLSEYILIPRGDNEHDHLGYIRDGEGVYRKLRTRLAVFRHLLTAGHGEVPSRKDVGLDQGPTPRTSLGFVLRGTHLRSTRPDTRAPSGSGIRLPSLKRQIPQRVAYDEYAGSRTEFDELPSQRALDRKRIPQVNSPLGSRGAGRGL